jgi:hypothetical protein
MGAELPEIGDEIPVPSDRREVEVGTVSAGETWSFAASGRWTNGFIACGPDGYRNFLFDALQIEPRAAGEPWFRLIGEIKGRPGSRFAIGAGCTRTFDESGELIVYANDSADGYSDNKGAVALRLRKGGVAPAPPADVGLMGAWRRFRDVFSHTKGIPIIAAFVAGVSWILVFMPQGRDLVRGIGEDDFWQYPSGLLQIAFALGLVFLGFEAWGWSRLVIVSNYGADRRLWRPRWLLVWGPRVLGALPFAAAAAALLMNSASNTWFVIVLIALGVSFFILVIRRQDIQGRLSARGGADPFRRLQRYSVIFTLVAAAVAMVVATLWPARFGALLGAPAVVFFGLGFIIPVIVIAIQMGSSLRIPVAGTLLVLAVVFGLWVDNHAVGRRAFGVATTGPTDRLSLSQAYEQWRAAQPGGANARKTMILVAVQGGASRAGYWTAVALANLREAAKAKDVDLDSHIFAISSVSGGSVGAVGYAAMLKSAPDPGEFKLRLLGFAGQDALGPAMTGMLFPDLLQRFLPVTFLPDRAEALERSWEEAWGSSGVPRSAAGVLGEPFLNLAPKVGEPWRPILIVQGASEGGGRRMLTSAVKLSCDEVDADDLLDGVGHDLAASTAILNGARFPWVSPGGTFTHQPCYGKEGGPKSSDHVLDGGYFDNAGAETLREMTRAIRNLPGGGDDVLDIVFILIGYDNHDPAKAPPPPPTGIKAWISDRIASLIPNDVFAPVLGLYNGMGAHEAHLAREMKLSSQTSVVNPDPYVSQLTGDNPYAALVLCPGDVTLKEGRTISYDPPMDWTLSGEAKRYIENSVIATSAACSAGENAKAIDAVVGSLKR